MEKYILKLPLNDEKKRKLTNWLYKKYTKCDFCSKGLFRFGGCHGAVDVVVTGNEKKTAYLCNLCYHLFKNI